MVNSLVCGKSDVNGVTMVLFSTQELEGYNTVDISLVTRLVETGRLVADEGTREELNGLDNMDVLKTLDVCNAVVAACELLEMFGLLVKTEVLDDGCTDDTNNVVVVKYGVVLLLVRTVLVSSRRLEDAGELNVVGVTIRVVAFKLGTEVRVDNSWYTLVLVITVVLVMLLDGSIMVDKLVVSKVDDGTTDEVEGNTVGMELLTVAVVRTILDTFGDSVSSTSKVAVVLVTFKISLV